MAVRVRLTRVGSRKNPVWRVVVADGRSKRDGRVLETVGRYNPQRQPSEIVLDRERIEHWVARGAQPSETVRSLLRATERDAPPERATPDGGAAAGGTPGGASEEPASPAAAEGEETGGGGESPGASEAPSDEPETTDDAPAEPDVAEEGPAVADAAPADAAGDVGEQGSERATAAGGG